jgi:phosphoribosylformylglycinamidine cyclo-ligase
MSEGLSYRQSGVNIDVADETKRAMADRLETADARVLNRIGAFASLVDARFPGYEHPVLVMKMEEPGSKQKLAFQYGRVSSVCYDLINHLVNDIIVMGAHPYAVQDVIVCGRLEKAVVTELVGAIADACRAQDCVLTGGETSEQPGVIDPGAYILAASIIGVVEKSRILDGSTIREGDVVLAAASNGLHTNGYSLVRALTAKDPDILDLEVDGTPFLDAIMVPHRCYYQAFKGLFDLPGLHGLAHITGGGIEGNLNRVLPDGLNAEIDLSRIRVLPIFKAIRDRGKVDDADMLRTYNMGVGMTLVADPAAVEPIRSHLAEHGVESYPIGEIVPGEKRVASRGTIRWE